MEEAYSLRKQDICSIVRSDCILVLDTHRPEAPSGRERWQVVLAFPSPDLALAAEAVLHASQEPEIDLLWIQGMVSLVENEVEAWGEADALFEHIVGSRPKERLSKPGSTPALFYLL
ncbi:hypothetical protein [Verrucomicrobium sp. GAS474]|uniref:hypothetical protein n=1 Tax=Verrucomicrobium sp. GAS474 TaxID=1882831 RepID=UPI0012FFAB0D|nr:hypothetical protein [Verrucomicrobium sp. GAS474]